MVEIIEYPNEAVYELRIPEQLSADDTQLYLDRFAQALATGQRFGAIFAYMGGRPRKARAADRLEDAWLKQHRDALSRQSFGIAMVSNPSITGTLSKIIMKGVGQRVFGCPCTLVYSVAEARAWLRTQREQTSPMSGTTPTEPPPTTHEEGMPQ